MSNELKTGTDTSGPTLYQIRVRSHLGQEWTDWFEGLGFTPQDNGDTLLTGTAVDQAALYGLLRKVRNLGLQLISVNRINADPAAKSDVQSESASRINKEEKPDQEFTTNSNPLSQVNKKEYPK